MTQSSSRLSQQGRWWIWNQKRSALCWQILSHLIFWYSRRSSKNRKKKKKKKDGSFQTPVLLWSVKIHLADIICTWVRGSVIPYTPSSLLNLPGVGWICLGHNDKAKPSPPLLHLLPGHWAFTVLWHTPPASLDTGCIIYVEKTVWGQTSIWPSCNINLSDLAPSLKHHIITVMYTKSCY